MRKYLWRNVTKYLTDTAEHDQQTYLENLSRVEIMGTRGILDTRKFFLSKLRIPENESEKSKSKIKPGSQRGDGKRISNYEIIDK